MLRCPGPWGSRYLEGKGEDIVLVSVVAEQGGEPPAQPGALFIVKEWAVPGAYPETAHTLSGVRARVIGGRALLPGRMPQAGAPKENASVGRFFLGRDNHHFGGYPCLLPQMTQWGKPRR